MNKIATLFHSVPRIAGALFLMSSACTPAEDPVSSTKLIRDIAFKNFGWQTIASTGEQLMGLHVVVLEPQYDCMSVFYDGAYYDPVFRISNPVALRFEKDHLSWSGNRFAYGGGIFAPGLIRTSDRVLNACHGQAILI